MVSIGGELTHLLITLLWLLLTFITEGNDKLQIEVSENKEPRLGILALVLPEMRCSTSGPG